MVVGSGEWVVMALIMAVSVDADVDDQAGEAGGHAECLGHVEVHAHRRRTYCGPL